MSSIARDVVRAEHRRRVVQRLLLRRDLREARADRVRDLLRDVAVRPFEDEQRVARDPTARRPAAAP